MAQQCKTKQITISSIVGSADFQRGVADFLAGKKPAFDEPGCRAWDYERGRLFAAARQGEGRAVPKSRNGRSVSRDCIIAYAEQHRARAVL